MKRRTSAVLHVGSILGRPGQHCLPRTRTRRAMAATRPASRSAAATHTLIFDAGTGIRPLGNALVEDARRHRLRHFPEPRPYRPRDRPAVLRAAVCEGSAASACGPATCSRAGGVEEAVRKLMSFPFFPLQVDASAGGARIPRLPRRRRAHRRGPASRLRTAALNHPGGATGYRIDYGGRSVAYVTDIECGDGPIDPARAGADQGCRRSSSSTPPTPTRNCPRMSAGAIRAGSRAPACERARAPASCACSTTTPSTTTRSWTRSRRDADAARPGTIVASEGLQVEL